MRGQEYVGVKSAVDFCSIFSSVVLFICSDYNGFGGGDGWHGQTGLVFGSLVFPVVDFCQKNHPVIRIVESPEFKNLHSKTHIILLNEDMLTNLII